jgi:protein-S-isoprenylcysteine O-methyltransferase Ste14
MKKRIKINGFIIFAASLLIILFPNLFFRIDKHVFLDEAMEIIGFSSILFGQILRVSSRGHKSEHSKNGYSLVQDGPYAMVRNPMYLGIVLIGLGISLLLFNLWVINLFLIVFIIRYLLLVFKEENKLIAAFPQEYPAYRKKVGRILPSAKIFFKKDISEYLPLKLTWLKKEIGSIIAVLIAVMVLKFWSNFKHLGSILYLKEIAAFAAVFILFVFFVSFLTRQTENNASAKSKNSL